MLFATTWPYVQVYRSMPPGYVYTWLLNLFPEDALSYLAWARQALNGQWLFSIKYTAVPHNPFLFHPFFLLCGWISRLTHLRLEWSLLLLKCFGVVLFFLIFFAYAEYLKFTRRQSMLAAIIIGTASGVGALFRALVGAEAMNNAGFWPIDLTGNLDCFWVLLTNPLYTYTLCLVLLVVYWADRGFGEKQPLYMVYGGLLLGLLTLLHPYQAPLMLFLLLLMGFLKAHIRCVAPFLILAAVSAPPMLYIAWLSYFNPVVLHHSITGTTASPDIMAILLGGGIPLALVIYGYFFYENRVRKFPFLLLWIPSAILIALLPAWFHTQVLLSLPIPISLLAGVTLDALMSDMKVRTLRKAPSTALALGLVALMMYTNVYLLRTYIPKTARPSPGNPMIIHEDVFKGLEFLRAHTRPDNLVFASAATSRLIPAFSGNRTIWGHWAMGGQVRDKQEWFDSVFSADSTLNPEKRKTLFWRKGFDYFFLDDSWGRMLNPGPIDWLLADMECIYSNATVSLYKRRLQQDAHTN